MSFFILNAVKTEICIKNNPERIEMLIHFEVKSENRSNLCMLLHKKARRRGGLYMRYA